MPFDRRRVPRPPRRTRAHPAVKLVGLLAVGRAFRLPGGPFVDLAGGPPTREFGGVASRSRRRVGGQQQYDPRAEAARRARHRTVRRIARGVPPWGGGGGDSGRRWRRRPGQQQQQPAEEQTAETTKKRSLFALAERLEHGFLPVTSPHELYYEVRGKRPTAPMALWLHGGPGAGCFDNHARFFDPDEWRVALVDQRGCGRSTPTGELDANTTPELVADLEALRRRLAPDGQPWACVVGGSWGSTLALAYAQTHPESVASLVLRGVCAMRAPEIRWLFAPTGGAATLNPRGWRDFERAASGVEVPATVPPEDRVLWAYHAMLTSRDKATRDKAARAWMVWESRVSSVTSRRAETLVLSQKSFSAGDEEPAGAASPSVAAAPPPKDDCARNPSTAYLCDLEQAPAPETPAAKRRRRGQTAPPQPLLTCHYSVHRGFLDGAGVLDPANLDAMRHIPAVAVQGGADLITPATTAFELHALWPDLELRLVPGAGHSQYDPDIMHELIEAIEAMHPANRRER